LNIIITGVSGFLGKNFVSYLEDFKISGVVRKSSSFEKFKEFPNVVLTSWDKLGHLDDLGLTKIPFFHYPKFI